MQKMRTIHIDRDLKVNLDVCMIEKNTNGNYECCLCQTMIKKYKDMLIHLQNDHTDDEIFDWDFC